LGKILFYFFIKKTKTYHVMKKLIYFIISLLSLSSIHAQVGIGTITPRGALEVNSTTNGLVSPQVALTATNATAPVVNPQTAGAPIAGTIVYNTATAGAGATAVTPGYYYWNGSAWLQLATGTNSDWALLGNAGTVVATNFLGTTDAIDFVTRTNNLERLRIKSTGEIGIGTSAPAAKLDVAAGVTTTNSIINATGSINDFLQFNIQNTSTGTQAQSGYSATADNGSATTGFAWLGINNSTFNFPTAYNIGLANDVNYIGSGQDMYIANANNTKSIIFSTGKAASPFFNERMRLTNAGSLGINTTSPSNRLHIVNDADGQGVLRVDNGTAGGFTGVYFYQGASYRGHIGYVNTGGASGFGGKGYYQLAAGDRPIIFSTNSGSELYVERVIFAQDGRVGINTNPTNLSTTVQPTSTLQVNGSFAIKTASVSTTSTLADDVCKVILSNGGSNITITLPNPTTCTGRLLSFSRNDSSTGTVTLDPSGSNNIQNLSGTVTNTTTIPIHSAAGAGVNVQFWSDGSVWYR
jgi:hypothetical protein